MDALGLRPGNVVADVGCGSGYFTFHLAARVGPQGRIYAVDVDDKELAKIRRRAAKESLTQIEAILRARDNPRLSAESADAVLVVNAYHEMPDYDAMLQGLYRALKPGGLLGMIEGRTILASRAALTTNAIGCPRNWSAKMRAATASAFCATSGPLFDLMTRRSFTS